LEPFEAIRIANSDSECERLVLHAVLLVTTSNQ
jgi:hypothetical protein